MKSEAGKLLATGELTQQAHGSQVTTRLLYKFLDGSVDDETVTYSQRGVFRLVRDRHIQKGPFFEKAIDYEIDASHGTVTSRSFAKDGTQKVETEEMTLPNDLANGFVGTVLLNRSHAGGPFSVSMLAPTGKGRVVKLVITPEGTSPFRVGGTRRTASLFKVHVDIGGVAGAIAPLVGKEPKDTIIWVLEGEVPALMREVGQLYVGGPIVSIELSGTDFLGNP